MLDISEVSKQSGFPASTLRYYEERGLITSIGRSGLRRIFGPDVLQRLSLISLGQVAGFSLDDIGEMMGNDGAVTINRSELDARADAIDRQIKELSALRDGLRHAARCRAPSYLQCQTFQRLMRIAVSRHMLSKRRNKAIRKSPKAV